MRQQTRLPAMMPRFRTEALDHNLVHSVVYGVALHQTSTKIECKRSLRTWHERPPVAGQRTIEPYPRQRRR